MNNFEDKINKARKQLDAELTKKYGVDCKMVNIGRFYACPWVKDHTEDTYVTLRLCSMKEDVRLGEKEAKDIYDRYLQLLNEE